MEVTLAAVPRAEVPQPGEPVTPAVPEAPVSPAVPDPGTDRDAGDFTLVLE